MKVKARELPWTSGPLRIRVVTNPKCGESQDEVDQRHALGLAALLKQHPPDDAPRSTEHAHEGQSRGRAISN